MIRSFLAAVMATAFAWGPLALAQDPPASEPPAPDPSEAPPAGSDADASTPKVVGPGTASGPPPLGNEAPSPDAAPPPGGEPPQGGDAPVQGLTTTAANPRASTATFPTAGVDATADEPYLYMGLGVGLLLLVGLGFVWSRGQKPAELDLPEGVVRLSQPPFITAPVPSLSDGMQVWSVPADRRDAGLTDLLTTLADAHRVLVVAPSDVALPRVAGGPVYRVDGMRPVHLEDPVDALVEDGGRPPVVVLVLPPEQLGQVSEFADTLPPGVGGVCLVDGAPNLPFPVVSLAPTARGWTLQRGEEAVAVARTSDGRLVPHRGGAEE